MSDPDRKCLLGDPNLGTVLRISLLGALFTCLVAAALLMVVVLQCARP